MEHRVSIVISLRPVVYCSLLRIGIPNENHDDTEQISNNTNLVGGYRLRTDDVVRATRIREVRATAVCVTSNTEYTSSISTAGTTATILLYVLYECVPVVSTIEPACSGPHIVETSKKFHAD